MTTFGDFQLGIYAAGLDGHVPALPVAYPELERRAAATLSPSLLSYVAGGSGDENTQRANVAAFDRWALVPRMLRASVERDLSVELFGHRLPTPVFLAPVGVIGLCSQDGHGDKAAARASARTGVPLIGSTLMQDPLESVFPLAGDTPSFFQLYTPTDRPLAESLIDRAERAGVAGIVVTLDTWTLGWRPRDLSTASFPQLRGNVLANYTSDPRFRELVGADVLADPRRTALRWAEIFGNPLTWDDLPWLRSTTSLPLILKGICHPDDARRAIDLGVDGIYCSTHGGRQANGGLAALDALPGVVAAAGDVPVLFDSGVRDGVHVVKALAMGARAVGIGRPYAYGLALGGSTGIDHVLRCLLAEADLTMALNGYPTIADLEPGALVRAGTPL